MIRRQTWYAELVAASAQWLSESPAKARLERIWLLYSPIWMALMGATMLTGWYRSWSDPAFMAFGLVLGLPPWFLPWLLPGDPEIDRPAWQRHWFRANVWIAVLVFVGSYFVTHYFFDVMGMRYGFPVGWTLQATVVGKSDGTVPLFLYPVTHAYFTTYFTVMVVLWRRFRNAVGDGWAFNVPFVLGVSYIIAWAETFFMASGIIEDVFLYESLERMLRYGSIFYGCLFVVSLPLYARLDEHDSEALGDASPTLVSILVESLGAGLLAIVLLEAWAWFIGPLTTA